MRADEAADIAEFASVTAGSGGRDSVNTDISDASSSVVFVVCLRLAKGITAG